MVCRNRRRIRAVFGGKIKDEFSAIELEKKGYDAVLSTSLRDWAEATELSYAEALKESLRAVSRRLVTPPIQRISHASH